MATRPQSRTPRPRFAQQEGAVSSPIPTTAGMPRDALHQEQIIQAAIALLDESGIESLTMRRLGSRLGITAAALYWHIECRRDLLLLAAMIIQHLDGPARDRHDEHLLAVCEGVRPHQAGCRASRPERRHVRDRRRPRSHPSPRMCPSDCSHFSTASKPGLAPVPDPTQQERQRLSSTALL
ncbi:hypothetical protein CTU88_38260 [Streptomyces sp. JV178]|uniref:TetR family transcriptional regulator n=1 Tax=Streptomyces sp. JV178 TaxID=858632 RepID=UPI000C1B2E6E|nr:TetR family transcriptional regulator [Streptomyces sp. JV178]PIM66890.1 hypothetical protein CTU88_38260 [Streptomyces sp. JV178]